MNKITKIARLIGGIGIGLLLLVIASGVAYPNPWFTYGAGLGILFVFVSIALFSAGWIFDLKHAVKQRNWLDIVVLLIPAVLFLYLFFRR